MKKSILFLSAFLAIALASCKNYDSDIDDINARLAAIETWQATVNTNINSLQTIVTALQGKDYVTGVVALSDGTGYQITFQNSGTITIKNGKDGVTPIIGTAKYTDGYYYWTVNTGSGATWMKDASGNMVSTTGDTPKMKIGEDGYWYVAADGVNYVSTGVKAQGDAVFAKDGVTVGNTSVTFTLADGTTTFSVPLYQIMEIAAEVTDDYITIQNDTTELSLTLPAGLKKGDFTSILAKIECVSGTGIDLKTRSNATDDAWGVKLVMPTYNNDLCNNDAKIIVIQPTVLKEENAKALVSVTLSMADGTTLITSRTLVSSNALENIKLGDIVYSDGTLSSAENYTTYGKYRTPIGVCFYVGSQLYDGENGSNYVTDLSDVSNCGYRKYTKPSTFHGYILALNDVANTNWDASITSAKNYNTTVDISSISDGWYLPSITQGVQFNANMSVINNTLTTLGNKATILDIRRPWWTSTKYNDRTCWFNFLQIYDISVKIYIRPVAAI